MFPQSTQKQSWIFNDEKEIASLRAAANSKFINKHGAHMTPDQRKLFFLSVEEEHMLLRNTEVQLREFCKQFNPPMPRTSIATALHYFKRFYLRNSVMDYHPKEILVTCVYLACKVEEFNVSISQFVANVRGDREKACNIILNNELLLMQHLKYNLTIHNPFRPVEGLIIDLKTRYPNLEDPEKLRPDIDYFLEKIFFTDSILMYSPSQIALAAILYAASKANANLDDYVTGVLFFDGGDHLHKIIEAVRKTRGMVKVLEMPLRDYIQPLEKKLDKCRNQDNNPDSETYKQRMQDMLDEEDFLSDPEKYAKLVQDQAAHDEKTLEGIQQISSPLQYH